MDFVHLHTHTASGSLGDAILTVDAAFKRAKELKMSALAISEHGLLASLLDARKASVKYGVKFLPAIEAYFVDDVKSEDKQKRRHIVLIAKNEIGYRNLLKLNYEGFKNNQFIAILGKVFPRIDWNILEQCHEGLICSTACSSGIIAKELYNGEDNPTAETREKAELTIMRLKDIFKDDLYLEIQPHGLRILATDRKSGEVVLKDGNELVVVDQHKYNCFLIDAHLFTSVFLILDGYFTVFINTKWNKCRKITVSYYNSGRMSSKCLF